MSTVIGHWLSLHRFFMAHRHDIGRDTTFSRFCGWCKFMRLSAFCPISLRNYRAELLNRNANPHRQDTREVR